MITDKTVAILAPNLLGNICRWEEIKLIADKYGLKIIEEIFKKNNPTIVINIAAQAGVRYSISNPQFYIDTNITGFLNILENSKNYNIKNIIYASSSIIYGIKNYIHAIRII